MSEFDDLRERIAQAIEARADEIEKGSGEVLWCDPFGDRRLDHDEIAAYREAARIARETSLEVHPPGTEADE